MGTFYYYITFEGDWIVVTTKEMTHMPNGAELISYNADSDDRLFFEKFVEACGRDLDALKSELSTMHYLVQAWNGELYGVA